ncbi:hypothetical protein CYMTET_15078 [Cymbomonas tetramitiformis]|uniref:UBA domain-containing protein n=1 Tax=Cymbomonas tetramitiformis TaxID=36881 RepID=A0AAE0GEZ0_9CHLO|nr:hypothetical protein CYMTET_15078 [Cymbomonas tetramitiformis]
MELQECYAQLAILAGFSAPWVDASARISPRDVKRALLEITKRLLPPGHRPLRHHEELLSISFGSSDDPEPLVAQFDECLKAIAASGAGPLDDEAAKRQLLAALDPVFYKEAITPLRLDTELAKVGIEEVYTHVLEVWWCANPNGPPNRPKVVPVPAHTPLGLAYTGNEQSDISDFLEEFARVIGVPTLYAAPAGADKKGPKVGDSASLWNFTLSPGWQPEEVEILKLALSKFGVGRWKEITESGCLPGKNIQQLNGQTQRLLGQQSIAAFTGLQVDVDKVREHNAKREDVVRKNGLIINTAGNMSSEEKAKRREENINLYGLTPEQIAAVVLREAEARDGAAAKSSAVNKIQKRKVQKLSEAARLKITTDILESLDGFNPNNADATGLSRPAKIVLLLHLRRRLQKLGGIENSTKEAMKEPLKERNSVDKKPVALEKRKPVDTEMCEVPEIPAAPADEVKAPRRGRTGRKTGGHKSAALPDPDDGSSGVFGALADQIVEMGFTRSKAMDALQENGGDLESAVNWLFVNV